MESLTEEQINFLDKFCVGKWEQTEKGIYVNGDVELDNNSLIKIPVKFYRVDGNFDCSRNKLTSLEGSPKYVDGYFFCDYNKLTSLEGIGLVKGRIFCDDRKINLKIEKERRPEIFKNIYIPFLVKMILEQ